MGAALLHGTALAQVAVPDFRLPPATPTTSAEPERQGPVAPDLPQSRPTPTPAPAEASPPAVQPPPPLVVPPAVTPAPTPPRSPRTAPATAPTPARQTAPDSEFVPDTELTPAPVAPSPDLTAGTPQPLPSAAPAEPVPVKSDEGGLTLFGWLAIAGLLGVGALLLVLRRRRSRAEPEPQPQPAERVRPEPAAAPRPAPAPVPAPAPAPAPAGASQIDIGLAGVELHVTGGRLSLSLMNAALTFQLTLRHDGPVPLTGLTLRADLIGAHAALRQDEQLGGPAPDAPMIAQLATLPPGETQTVAAEVRLPLAQVTAIRQGRSSLFVPLLRLALEGEGLGRRTQTTLIGPPGQGGQVQPLRLDEGPRVVAPLLARVLG